MLVLYGSGIYLIDFILLALIRDKGKNTTGHPGLAILGYMLGIMNLLEMFKLPRGKSLYVFLRLGQPSSYWRAQIGHMILWPITVAACNLLWGSGEEKLMYILTMH